MSSESSVLLEPVAPENALTHVMRRPDFAPTPPPQRLNPQWPCVRDYEILSVIGSGGMGIVYKARHRHLRRTVALKMLRGAALADPEFHERFQVEAEAVARLQHPNIIQVFEIGSVENYGGEFHASPFISLELVDGGSLARCTREPQAPRDAAEMIEKLARAVDFAHRQGIIHRDLKPANVLLTSEGEPKIADFGLAKQLGPERDAGGRFVTQAGTIVGTPEYMAPEQAAGKEPTPAVDIYALGVILYEMLTGEVPFRAATPVETMHLMLHRDPAPPHQLVSGIPWDLETVCLKCLEKEPSKRYATAGELADDLRSCLDKRPIRARRLNALQRTVRWCRRNPFGAGILGIFVIAFVLVTFSYWRTNAAWREEAYQRREAENKEKAERWERYRAYIAATASALQVHNVDGARRNLEETPAEYRNWEWRHFQSRLDMSERVLHADDATVTNLRISSDGNRAFLFGRNGFARIWNTNNAMELYTFENAVELGDSTLSDDGRLFARVTKENSIVIREVDSNRIISVLRGHLAGLNARQFTAAGSRYFTASEDGTECLWDVASGESIRVFRPFMSRPYWSKISPDGRRLVTSSDNGKDVRLIDTETGNEIATLPGFERGLEGVCFTRRCDRFVTGDGFPENELRMWDANTGKLIAVLGRHANTVTEIAFNSDGTRFASASMDQTLRLWDGLTGKPIATLSGHYGRVACLGFSPDGKQLVSGSRDHTARVWDSETGGLLAVLSGHTSAVLSVAFSGDGKRIVTGSADDTFRLWDAQAVENYGVLRGHQKYAYSVAFLTDGKRVASAGWDGTVRIWDLASGKETKVLDHGSKVYVTSVVIHPDGRTLASRVRGWVYLWDIETGRELYRWKAPSDGWKDSRLALSPDGNLLATGCYNGLVRVWEVRTRREIANLQGHKDSVRDLAFSPDGKCLATAGESADKTIRIWNVATWEQEQVLEGNKGCVYSLAFSRDGKWLASGSEDRTASLWDTTNWKEIAHLNIGSSVFGLAFTPDESRLACACADNTIRLWDVATAQTVAELRGHRDYVHSVAFSPDGTKLVSASGDFTLRIWDTVSPQERAARE